MSWIGIVHLTYPFLNARPEDGPRLGLNIITVQVDTFTPGGATDHVLDVREDCPTARADITKSVDVVGTSPGSMLMARMSAAGTGQIVY